MPEPADPWAKPVLSCAPVPLRYRGVWERTLLQTSDLQDETTFVRWMQLASWHADLRIPSVARAGFAGNLSLPYSTPQQVMLGLQQGFCGITQVQTDPLGEVCTWHRLVDYHPAGPSPDAGRMVFESPDCVIESGVHGLYREVWQRLPGSTGRFIALAEPPRSDGAVSARLFLAGHYLMRVRPTRRVWLPEFEITFGKVEGGRWLIEHSTRPELEGQSQPFALLRTGLAQAHIDMLGAAPADWRVLEWEE